MVSVTTGVVAVNWLGAAGQKKEGQPGEDDDGSPDIAHEERLDEAGSTQDEQYAESDEDYA